MKRTHHVTTLRGHQSGVECVAVGDSLIASGATPSLRALWRDR